MLNYTPNKKNQKKRGDDDIKRYTIKQNIISFAIGGGICIALFLGINHYENKLAQKDRIISGLSKEISANTVTISNLRQDKDILNSANIQLEEDYISLSTQTLQSIEPLRLYDKQTYIIAYLNIIEDLEDAPEQPQDVMSVDEYDMFCRIVEAEIGNGNFEQKCGVASAIINRYDSEVFPDSWMECFMQESNGVYQFSSVENGMYKNVDVTFSTRNAIAYCFMIEDMAQGCTYFRSGTSDTWHDKSDNLEMVFSDTKHTYYKLKEEKK